MPALVNNDAHQLGVSVKFYTSHTVRVLAVVVSFVMIAWCSFAIHIDVIVMAAFPLGLLLLMLFVLYKGSGVQLEVTDKQLRGPRVPGKEVLLSEIDGLHLDERDDFRTLFVKLRDSSNHKMAKHGVFTVNMYGLRPNVDELRENILRQHPELFELKPQILSKIDKSNRVLKTLKVVGIVVPVIFGIVKIASALGWI